MYSVWKLYVCKTGASRLLLCYSWLCIGHSWYSVILPFPLKTHKQISDAHLAVGAKQSGLFGLQEGLICIEKILYQSRWLGSEKSMACTCMYLYFEGEYLQKVFNYLRFSAKWKTFSAKVEQKMLWKGAIYTLFHEHLLLFHRLRSFFTNTYTTGIRNDIWRNNEKSKPLNLILWNTCLTQLENM